MNSIMVDNWFMEEVIADIKEQKTHRSRCYGELLMAIVLWDEVYYPKNNYNWWNSIPSQVQNALIPLDDCGERGVSKSLSELHKHKGIAEDDSSWLKWKNNAVLDVTDVIGSGAIRYLALSSNNGLDYLPCAKRQKFLKEYCSQSSMIRMLTRLKLQDALTKTVEAYYVDAYKSLGDFSNLQLKMPVLANYIVDMATNNMSPVDFAFHLKNEGPVIRYREFLRNIDDSLEKQDWKELKYLLRCSEDAVSSVISMDSKKIESVSVEILPTPRVIFNFSGETVKIGEVPSLTLKQFEKHFKKFSLVFLKDITKYAIEDMRRW